MIHPAWHFAWCILYFSYSELYWGLSVICKDNYSLMAAELQVFFSFLSALTTHQFTLEVCNHWRLWHTCSLIWQEIVHFSSSIRFTLLFSFFFHIHSSLTMLIQVLIMSIAVNKLNFEMAIYEETKPSTKASQCSILSQRKNWDARTVYKSYMLWGKWSNSEWWQRIHTICTQSYLRLGKNHSCYWDWELWLKDISN